MLNRHDARIVLQWFSRIVTKLRLGFEDVSQPQNTMGWLGGEMVSPPNPGAACALDHLSEAKPRMGSQ